MKIKIVNKSTFELPKYETAGASGMDLRANITEPVRMKSLERVLIPTGLFLQIPNGYEVQIRARSGLSIKYGITLINAVGTIDSDYRGEIKVPLVNLSKEDYIVQPGDRICQMILCKYEKIDLQEVESLEETERGSGGFGHTGF